MLRKMITLMALLFLVSMFSSTATIAQELQREYDPDNYSQEYYDRTRIDRYLNVEIWTDHDNDEFYEGDHVKFYYRVSRDAFVAIYSIDSKGRVNLLFPSSPRQDNYVAGGVTLSLPGRDDDYDLVVSGPEGVENIQIIASREPFPIPDWYNNSGLFCDWEDRHAYMDWVNSQYFVKYEGQKFAYDRTSLYIYEWEPNYFRPVYRPYYPHWTVCGNVYVDYWPGSSIYIDGVFWGVTPCYIPRIYVGWHTFTVYDRYNYCWEYDVHVTRYNTVVLNHTVINPQPSVRSKYTAVRFSGYQDPVKVGYKDYDKKVKVIETSGSWKTETKGKIIVDNKEVQNKESVFTGTKKFVKGSSEVVKTERGIETAGASVKPNGRDYDRRGIGSGSVGKGTTGSSDDKATTRSIFKRTDNNSRSSGKSSGMSTSKQNNSNVEKRESPSSSRKVGNSSSKEKKAPSSSTVNKKPAPSKSDNDDGGSKIQKSSPPSQNSGSAPKKVGGSSGQSGSPKASAGKSSGSSKSGKTGSGKKGGGN